MPFKFIPNDNLWHHVAVEHVNGVEMKYYLDGVLGSETAYTRGPGARTSFTISTGGSVANLNNPFTGSIDRIRVTKGAIPPELFDFPISVALTIQRNGASNTLSWPLTAGDVVPQSTSTILPTNTVWADVLGTPVTNGTTVSLSVPVGANPKIYYRLRPGP